MTPGERLDSRPRRYLRLSVIATALAFALAPPPARSDTGTSSGQFHFRLGPVSGSFNGPESGSFSVATSIDGELERFVSSYRAMVFRALISYDTTNARVVYAYTGAGHRWYVWSAGTDFNNADGGTTVTRRMKRRYYIGVEGGISQVLVRTVGPVLQIQSAALEFGGNLGIIQQINDAWGVELQAGYTKGFGFSSVAVSATTTRFLLGISIFF